jgi:thiamine biosynthesis protein ThiI
MTAYCNDIKLVIIPFTEIQEEIHKHCPAELMITIMRRFMMRIAERVAKENFCEAIITGESLGQVASQTIQSINCTNSVVDMPVLRPLIGMDKNEIIGISKKIKTFETSIEPYQDCCTVFLPKNPAIRPKKDFVEECEKRLNIDELIEKAISKTEVKEINA